MNRFCTIFNENERHVVVPIKDIPIGKCFKCKQSRGQDIHYYMKVNYGSCSVYIYAVNLENGMIRTFRNSDHLVIPIQMTARVD